MPVLDTNAVIGYLADDPALVACIDRCGEAGADMALATISIVELLGFSRSYRGNPKRN